MKKWQRLRDWFTGADAASNYQFDSAPQPIDQMIGAMLHGTARVSREDALSVPAVQRGRNLICSISTLPLVQYGPGNEVARNPLLEQLDPDVPNVVMLAQTLEDLLFEGIAWWEKTATDFTGFPVAVRHLNVNSVSLQPPGMRSPSPLPSGQDPRGAFVYIDGEPVPASRVIRFDSPNPAVLKAGGRAIRRALLLDKAAGMYADDPRPLDFFTPADGADPVDDDDIKDSLSKWKTSRKERSTAYVPAALKYNTVDSPSPADLQLVELQRQASLDIANALCVDPEDLGVSTTSRTYANAVDRRRDRINDVLSPYMRAITDRLSMGDVTRRGHRVAFKLDDYMKANPTERWGVYEKALDKGVMTVEEIRAEEGLPAVQAGEPTPAPDVPAAVDAHRRAGMTFDSSGIQFADLPLTSFSVDSNARTIEGLAVPYGQSAAKFGLKFRFAKGALQWGDPGRVKLLRDHDSRQAIGRAVKLTDTAAGLQVRFKVARGEEGDRALALAEDGVLDGMSVGVDFDMAVDTVPDPKDKTVTLVRRADLREVSLTAVPSFDDARVSKVAASRTQGDNVSEDTTTEPTTAQPGPAVVPGATFNAQDIGTIMAAMQNWQAATSPRLPVAEPERPQFVNPTRLNASASVNEAAPYRFDRKGNIHRGTHDFSQDVFAYGRGDEAAGARVMEFVRAQFDVVTTNVDELNPTRQRPDMYVDQRDFQYPIWQAINKGTLTDVTPFTFPKFSSAGSLVAAHTEGVEPSSGTFVTTSQTVTPTAVSGKMKITRETWDQGGNPQVSNLIWRQMLKAWYEALEAAAVAVLDAATPTGIDLSGTPGMANDELDQALTSAFAALQFVRGGFSMDNMFTQIDLYKALVAAVDANGRRLYPALGPTNANGQVRGRWAALDINGVVALPAWALAATGTVAASSYLFDSEVVHGWASAPQRLDFNIEVANVYIGLWGYKATAISDITGVREVIYDPA
jgi:HK97 family phage prohead protease